MKEDHSFSEASPFSPEDIRSVIGDNEATIVSGTAPEDIKFTHSELRNRLGIPEDEMMTNYKNLHPIGLGGVGAVYSGNEPGTNREVAIKILRPQYRYSTERIESFVREARATAQIDHPNVVPVYRFGVFENEGIFFSMKRVRGETLRNVLRKLAEGRSNYERKYTLRRLINIFLGACNGVAFANKNGILHGDLKPGNIMIGEFGEVMVMDWGMACYRPELDTFEGRKKIRLGSREELRREEEQLLVSDTPIGGTPVFMAPEHLTGEEKKLTETSEVYALGTILYSILTWKMAPYDTDLPREKIVQQVVRGRFVTPRKAAPRKQPVPRELEAICCKAMAKDPGRRFKNVSEMVDEIQNYLDGFPVRSYSPSPLYRMSKWLGRHPLIPVTLVALVLGVGGFKAYTLVQVEAENRSRFNLAQYNANRAFELGRTVRKYFRKLQHGEQLEYEERFALVRDLNKVRALMENANDMALASLSLLPRNINKKNSPRLVLSREIFRNAVTLYRELGEIGQLQEAVDNFRRRWGKLFLEVLDSDPELLRLIILTESRRGYLKITLPSDDGYWRAELATAAGEKVDIKEKELSQLLLPAQDYVVTFRGRRGEKFYFPVRVSAGRNVFLSPGFPRQIPPDLCYIGRGEIPVQDLVHSMPGGDIPAFMISKYEVSIGEYFQFWKTLPEKEKARHLPMTSVSRDHTLKPMWDKNGKLRPPYHKNLPVTGISAHSARAYCRYLSKKRQMKIRLPQEAEWKKAAFRFPEQKAKGIFYSPGTAKLFPAGAPVQYLSQDVSVYGVVNTLGNVREILHNTQSMTSRVIGGSFLTPESIVNLHRIQYTVSGDNDIGFRYVVEMPE